MHQTKRCGTQNSGLPMGEIILGDAYKKNRERSPRLSVTFHGYILARHRISDTVGAALSLWDLQHIDHCMARTLTSGN